MQAHGLTVAVGGSEAVLHPFGAPELATVPLPARASLSFDCAGHPVMLSGMAAEGPIEDTLRFFVIDGVGREDQRMRPRLAVRLNALVTPRDAAGALIAAEACLRETVDISAGGVLLAGHAAAMDSLLDLELALPGLAEPLRATARVVRQPPAGTAVTFVDLDPALQQAVDQLIFTVRRQMAREMAHARR